MGDTILTWKWTNLITIAVMITVISVGLVLISQGVHMATGNKAS